MIKQAYINGITTLVFTSIGIVICLIASIILVKYIIFPAIEKGRDYHSYEVDLLMGYGLLTFFILAMVSIVGCYAGDIVTSFANPEYWALMQLKF